VDIAGGATGFRVLRRLLDEDRAEEVLVRLSDDWSEPVMEAVPSTAGAGAARLWSECPRHPHALNPKLIDGEACWCCDLDRTIAFPVGSLPFPGSASSDVGD
jgi:hypothetical protein